MRTLVIVAALVIALGAAFCVSAAFRRAPAHAGQTAIDVGLAEDTCMSRLQSYLTNLHAKRMDTFFAAALNGLVRCEAYSGLAHVPTREITRWLARANGHAPPDPRALKPFLARLPQHEDERLPYQRACSRYMRTYLPASISDAGDDPDIAAAFIFDALEECDSAAGFATIPPHDLADIMRANHLL